MYILRENGIEGCERQNDNNLVTIDNEKNQYYFTKFIYFHKMLMIVNLHVLQNEAFENRVRSSFWKLKEYQEYYQKR